MEHVLVRRASLSHLELMKEWLRTTRDGELFDPDVLEHESTFVQMAFSSSGPMGFLPVQQPLMLENLIFRPGLSRSETALVIAKLTESAVAECYVRDAGEAYFLCRDETTLAFAERHKFTALPAGLQVRRLNLLETFPQ